MSHRIREVMRTGTFKKLSGTVEADETYVGGLEKNRHTNKKKDAQGGAGKAIVFGAVERGGEVQASVIDGATRQDIENSVMTSVTIGSKLFTDE